MVKRRLVKATKLTLTSLIEGSLVDAGANQHADIVLFKSKKSAGDRPAVQKEAGMSGDKKTELEQITADLAAADAENATLVAKVADTEKRIATLEGEIKAREKDAAEARKALEVETAKNADPEEELLKGMSDPARKLFLAQKAETDRLRKRLSEDDKNRDIEKAATEFAVDFKSLPLTRAESGPIMHKLAGALDADEMVTLRKALKAGSDALAEVEKLAGFLGNNGLSETGAEAEIDKKAKELATSKSIDYNVAYAQVLKAEPELYAKARAERN